MYLDVSILKLKNIYMCSHKVASLWSPLEDAKKERQKKGKKHQSQAQKDYRKWDSKN